MSPRSRKEYLEAIYVRYKKASRKEKAGILDEFCAACDYHRKHAIRLLRTFRRYHKPKHKKNGKPPIYDKESILKPLSVFGMRQTSLAPKDSKRSFLFGCQVIKSGMAHCQKRKGSHFLAFPIPL